MMWCGVIWNDHPWVGALIPLGNQTVSPHKTPRAQSYPMRSWPLLKPPLGPDPCIARPRPLHWKAPRFSDDFPIEILSLGISQPWSGSCWCHWIGLGRCSSDLWHQYGDYVRNLFQVGEGLMKLDPGTLVKLTNVRMFISSKAGISMYFIRFIPISITTISSVLVWSLLDKCHPLYFTCLVQSLRIACIFGKLVPFCWKPWMPWRRTKLSGPKKCGALKRTDPWVKAHGWWVKLDISVAQQEILFVKIQPLCWLNPKFC